MGAMDAQSVDPISAPQKQTCILLASGKLFQLRCQLCGEHDNYLDRHHHADNGSALIHAGCLSGGGEADHLQVRRTYSSIVCKRACTRGAINSVLRQDTPLWYTLASDTKRSDCSSDDGIDIDVMARFVYSAYDLA
jgi:hypothetical protein